THAFLHFLAIPPLYSLSVPPLLDLCLHTPQILGEGTNSVAFFDAQFRRIANLDAFFRVRTQRRQHRQLINHQRNAFAGNTAALQRGAFHGEIADDFSLRTLQTEHLNRSAHFGEDIEDDGPRGIQAPVAAEPVA